MSWCACECVDGKETENIAHVEGNHRHRLQFVQAGKSVQHPLKSALSSTNADAFAADRHMIGIADGVSTVEDEGLDPSELPVELLANCLQECKARMENSMLFDAEAEDLLSGCDVELCSSNFPLYVLSKASVQCTTFGSTTCVLAILENNRLWSANIGDSQLLVIRRTDAPPKAYPRPYEFSFSTCHDSRCRVSNPRDYGGYQIVYRTVPQQHFFNCPYQFSRMPDIDCSGDAILKRTVETADIGSTEVQPGDIVILGTDGLFDNAFDDDILDLLNRTCWPDSEPNKPPTTDPAILVDALIDIAVKAGHPPSGFCRPIVTPFSKAAFDEVGRRLMGGKPDDITAVVAYVVSTHEFEKGGDNFSIGSAGVVRASRKGEEKVGTQAGRPNESQSHESSKGSPPCAAIAEAQLSLLEGLGGMQVSPAVICGSRSSFPPRLHGATTPAIKASIHSVPKPLKATDLMAFEHLRKEAQHRVQKVVSIGPPQRNIGGDGWVAGKTAMFFNALTGLFSRN